MKASREQLHVSPPPQKIHPSLPANDSSTISPEKFKFELDFLLRFQDRHLHREYRSHLGKYSSRFHIPFLIFLVFFLWFRLFANDFGKPHRITNGTIVSGSICIFTTILSILQFMKILLTVKFPPFRLETWLFGKFLFGCFECLTIFWIVISYASISITRAINSSCSSCRASPLAGGLPLDTYFLFLLPLLGQTFFRALRIEVLILIYLVVFTSLVVQCTVLDSSYLLAYLLPFFSFSLFASYETQVQRIKTFVLEKESAMRAEEMSDRKYKHELASMKKDKVQDDKLRLRGILGRVSHDLQTPIQSVLTNVETIEYLNSLSLRVLSHPSLPDPIASLSSDRVFASSQLQQAKRIQHLIRESTDELIATTGFMSMQIRRSLDYVRVESDLKLIPKTGPLNIIETLQKPLQWMQKMVPNYDKALALASLTFDDSEELGGLGLGAGRVAGVGGDQSTVIMDLETDESDPNLRALSSPLKNKSSSNKSNHLSEPILDEPVLKFLPPPASSGLHPILVTDPTWLIDNTFCLLSNAVRYSDDHASITLSVDFAPEFPPRGEGGKAGRMNGIGRGFLSSSFRFTAPSPAILPSLVNDRPQGDEDLTLPSSLSEIQSAISHAASSFSLPSSSPQSDRVAVSRRRKTGEATPTPTPTQPNNTYNRSNNNQHVDSQSTHSDRSFRISSASNSASNSTPSPSPTRMVRVSVSDKGRGVPPSRRKALFAPLNQLDPTVGGSGIGLYTLAMRIQALGGEIGVEDRADGLSGSVFFFSFPYHPDFKSPLNHSLHLHLDNQQSEIPNQAISLSCHSSESTFSRSFPSVPIPIPTYQHAALFYNHSVSMGSAPHSALEKDSPFSQDWLQDISVSGRQPNSRSPSQPLSTPEHPSSTFSNSDPSLAFASEPTSTASSAAFRNNSLVSHSLSSRPSHSSFHSRPTLTEDLNTKAANQTPQTQSQPQYETSLFDSIPSRPPGQPSPYPSLQSFPVRRTLDMEETHPKGSTRDTKERGLLARSPPIPISRPLDIFQPTTRLGHLLISRPLTKSGLPKLRVLIVEDSFVVLKAIQKSLVNQGHEVHTAVDGQKALRFLSTNNKYTQIDLVLSDLQMPVMDGLQFAKSFREFEKMTLHQTQLKGQGEGNENNFQQELSDSVLFSSPHLTPSPPTPTFTSLDTLTTDSTPFPSQPLPPTLPPSPRLLFIGMSANSGEEVRESAIDAGMDDFIEKPFGADQFVQCVSKHL